MTTSTKGRSITGASLIHGNQVYQNTYIDLSHMFRGRVRGYVQTYDNPWITLRKTDNTTILINKGLIIKVHSMSPKS